MKQGVLIACVMLLLMGGAGRVVVAAPDTVTPNEGSGAITAPPAKSRESSEQPEGSFEEWTEKRAGPWLACVILGTYRYAQYLLDKANWLNIVIFSNYLEKGDCFYRDLQWAAEIYREGAKAGREAHALYLGYLYLKGLGVERNVDEARRWFDLGVLYQIDADRKYQIDRTKFIMWHRGMPPELMNAIERGRKKFAGDGADILGIAKSLRFGTDGMTRNVDAAKELYSIADRAILSFTRQYRLKEPVFENVQAGFLHYKRRLETAYQVRGLANEKYEIYVSLKRIYEFATSDNHGPSQKLIAELFRKGHRVERDFFVAYVFFRSAQNTGLPVADRIKQVRRWLSPEQIAEAEDDIRQGKIIRYDYRDIRKNKLPQKPKRIAKRAQFNPRAINLFNPRAINLDEPDFENFEARFQYYKRRLEISVRSRDPKKRKYEIYWWLERIYNLATLGDHAPSQKIIGEIFLAGEVVKKDLFVAYVFYGSAQQKGQDVAEEIERIRPQLTPEQISEAKSDIRQGNIIRYDYRDIRKKKLPRQPSR